MRVSWPFAAHGIEVGEQEKGQAEASQKEPGPLGLFPKSRIGLRLSFARSLLLVGWLGRVSRKHPLEETFSCLTQATVLWQRSSLL